MCSELFRIPMTWQGVPIFGFGLLLAAWCIVGGAVLWNVRKGPSGASEVWGYLPALALGAIAIVALPRLMPSGLPIRGYGLMVLLGSVAGLWMAGFRARQAGLSVEVIHGLAFWMFILGILGARLFFVIEYWEERFSCGDWRETLVEALKFTEGGLVVYGALAGAMLAFVGYTLKHRLPPLAMADLIAPSLVAGLALGRLGCLLNGCCYGGVTDVPWAVQFPADSLPTIEQARRGTLFGLTLTDGAAGVDVLAVVEASPGAEAGLVEGDTIRAAGGYGVRNRAELADALLATVREGRPLALQVGDRAVLLNPPASVRSRPIHPTQIYSAVNAALLCWLLWTFYAFRRSEGEVTALMLLLYPVARFLLEVIRVDESPVFGTEMSISQNISLAVFVLAAAAMLWLRSRNEPRLDFPLATVPA
ncbi:MAG: prolipoprotein diacylglyceryl transferase family protein [Planctomycetota bacterium]